MDKPINIWIVILNKVIKGPLTTEEVKALMARGLLKPNDVAVSLDPETKKPRGGSGWKLLWQYEEFDRRRPQSEAEREAAGRPAPSPPRNRKPMPEEEVRARLASAVPNEFESIQPEDLIHKSKPMVLLEIDMAEPQAQLRPGMNSDPGQPSGIPQAWLYGVGLLLVLVYFAFYERHPTVAVKGEDSAERTPAIAKAGPSNPVITPPSGKGRYQAAPPPRPSAVPTSPLEVRPRNLEVRDDRPPDAIELPMSVMEEAIQSRYDTDSSADRGQVEPEEKEIRRKPRVRKPAKRSTARVEERSEENEDGESDADD